MKKSVFLFLFYLLSTVSLFCAALSWEQYKQETIQELPTIPGWCTKEKAELLMDLIYETQPNICIEIGAFGGSTTYPLARALQFNGQGILYTIDAWDNQTAIKGLERNDPNTSWWSNLDMKAIYCQFVSLLSRKQLTNFCRPIPVSSENAISIFSNESIDFLYIDGNFSNLGALQDVLLYFPKVKMGGYICLNDSDCESKNKALAHLMKNCQWLKAKSLGKSCIVFKK
jgi:hypothetical protein